MFVPRGSQQKKSNESAISTLQISPQAYSGDDEAAEEPLTNSLMWSNRPMSGRNQRGGHSSDITQGMHLAGLEVRYAIFLDID